MRLAFCVKGADEPLVLDDRFGRCHSFVVVEARRSSESIGVIKVLENTGRDASGAAGTVAVQMLAREGVEGFVAPQLGPKADDARTALGLKVWNQGGHESLESALNAWRSGDLEEPAPEYRPQGLYRA